MADPLNEIRWLRQFRSAVQMNAQSEVLAHVMLLDGLMDKASSAGLVLEMAEAVAWWVKESLPFRFTGTELIVDVDACMRRGHAACGDGSAAVAAAVLALGGSCSLCYETDASTVGYAHVRVQIGRSMVDAYAGESLDVPRCASVLPLTRESMKWPTRSALADLLDVTGHA